MLLEGILITVVGAATPIVLAAIGELVVERSGVLNLGVEGMMIMGAVVAFGVSLTTGNPHLGAIAGGLAGVGMSLLFGLFTVYLASNQVATGLALTLLGLGLAGLIGESFVGTPVCASKPSLFLVLARSRSLVRLSLIATSWFISLSRSLRASVTRFSKRGSALSCVPPVKTLKPRMRSAAMSA